MRSSVVRSGESESFPASFESASCGISPRAARARRTAGAATWTSIRI